MIGNAKGLKDWKMGLFGCGTEWIYEGRAVLYLVVGPHNGSLVDLRYYIDGRPEPSL